MVEPHRGKPNSGGALSGQVVDQRRPLRFSMRAVLYAMALFAAGLGSFGVFPGAIATLFVLGFWTYVFSSPSPRRALVYGFLFLLAMALVMLMSIPQVNSDRQAATRPTCIHSARMIALAILNYESANGTLPPAFVTDKDGRPMHSWRVLILPYLEEDALYRKYKFDEPWDGPNNIKLLDQMPAAYRCAQRVDKRPGFCHYSAVVGSETVWPGAQRVTLAQITDGPSRTILVVEHPTGVPWTKPSDLTADEYLELVAASRHLAQHRIDHDFSYSLARIAPVMMCDQHTRITSGRLDPLLTRAMLTRAGSESVDEDDWLGSPSGGTQRQRFRRWDKIISWVVFFSLAIGPVLLAIRSGPVARLSKSSGDGYVRL